MAIVPALTADGFTAPRAADFLDTIREEYETRTGITPDWDRDEVIGQLSAIMADQLDAQAQSSQAGYDARRRASATGIQLDDIGAIIGVTREDATYSRATVRFSGTNGTFIGTGFIVEGGGTGDDERWATIEDATIAAGIASVLVQAQNPGAIVATIGQIDAIVTPKTGVTAVTNLVAATPGVDRELDSAYRSRQAASLQISGSAAANAIYAKLVQLSYIESATVVENDDSIYQTISGIYMDPNAIAVVLWPNTLTTAEQEAVAEVIYTHTPAGTKTMGAVGASVAKPDGLLKLIYWDWASTDGITVSVATTPRSGYTLADYHDALVDAIAEWFLTLRVGAGVTRLDISVLAGAITNTNTGERMIAGATVLLDGMAADYPGVATTLVTLTGSAVVT